MSQATLSQIQVQLDASGNPIVTLANTMNATPLPADALGVLKDDGSGNLSWASLNPFLATSITVSGAASLGATAVTTLTATGLISPMQHVTSGAPSYVKGALYFDTTLNKLRVGGAAGWETITSV